MLLKAGLSDHLWKSCGSHANLVIVDETVEALCAEDDVQHPVKEDENGVTQLDTLAEPTQDTDNQVSAVRQRR